MITLHTPFPALLPPSFQLILCKIPPKPWIHCTWLLSNIQLPGACGYLLSPCQWHHWLNPWFQIQLSLQYPLSIFLLSLSKLPLLSPQLLFQAHNLASSPLYNFKVILDNVQSSSTWNQRVFLISSTTTPKLPCLCLPELLTMLQTTQVLSSFAWFLPSAWRASSLLLSCWIPTHLSRPS